MAESNWQVYYGAGLKPGVKEEQAIRMLASMMKLSPEDAGKIIKTTNRVVKSGLTQQQAEKYRIVLDRVGMQVTVQESESSTKAAPEAPPAATASTPVTAPEPSNEPPPVPATVAEAAPPAPPTTPTASAVDEDDFQAVPVEFHGQSFEYFKIWIVNIFLTILTLGIYSAWAKVRNKRYFYGSTRIDGSSFEYTARPITILKGRLIAVGVFIIYSLVSQALPIVGLLLLLVFLVFFPWLVVRSLAFNARNSMYRNIRFNFNGSAFGALKVFVLWPLLMLPTFGLILPYIWYKQQQFIVNHSSFGTTSFTIEAEARDYYRIFLIALGGLIAVGIVGAILMALLGPMAVAITGPLSLVVYLVLFAYLMAALGNLYFNFSRLDRHAFVSQLETKQMAILYLTNAIGIVLSLGLLIPWAKIRLARYRAECLTLQVAGGLDHFVEAEHKQVSALGEEMGEVFDFEISLV